MLITLILDVLGVPVTTLQSREQHPAKPLGPAAFRRPSEEAGAVGDRLTYITAASALRLIFLERPPSRKIGW